jgi:Asp-tRNA(Asn)/Glu-tRNA(Gln) amidotransferase A subunit family amidase
MAATLADLLALYSLMADAPVPEDPLSARKRFRVGVPSGFFTDRVHDQTLSSVGSVAASLQTAGAEVEPTEGSGLDNVRVVWMSVCCVEFAGAHPLLKDPERRRLVAPSVLGWLDLGESQTGQLRTHALGERERIQRWFADRLGTFDALLIPTTPYPAPRADQETVDLGEAGTVEVNHVGPGWITCSVNLAGLPAINVPVGRSTEGTPIGASLVAKPGEEAVLFALAAAWAAAAGQPTARPSVPKESGPGVN